MRLSDRVYLVGGSAYGISPMGDCNVYLVDGGSELALVDTGGGHGVKAILNNIKKDGLDPSRITVAFNTHCHFDHIGGNFDLKDEMGCRIVAHEADKTSIETLDECSLYDMARVRGLSFKPVKVDVTLRDGDAFNVGEVPLKVVHTPGHTPGCISLQMQEGELTSVFTGDIASSQGNLGYINGPSFNLNDWKGSIKRLLEMEPDRIYPGHNTFVMSGAMEHLELYDQKMNAPWINIITSLG